MATVHTSTYFHLKGLKENGIVISGRFFLGASKNEYPLLDKNNLRNARYVANIATGGC